MYKGFQPELTPATGDRVATGKNTAASAHALAYRADIDGLRAIAILAVVIFHAELGFLTGGFVGVDVFFVISGFLISSIVLKEAQSGSFSLLNFYKRRTLRIFPALFTVIAACFIAGWFILPPDAYRDFASSAIAAAAFYSNFYFENNSNYFAAEAITMPLLHTWSLAVEEQFYVVAPGLLLLAVRFPRYAKAGFLLLFAASLAISAVQLGTDPAKAFYMLPSRAFELMTGTALAMGLVPAIRNRMLAEAAGLAGLALIAFAVITYSHDTDFPGFAALAPCIGAALIIHSGRHAQTAVAKMLATSPMVFIGKISYSLYLWHWPFLVFAIFRYGADIGMAGRIGLIAAAILASAVSYYLVEQPARQRGAAWKGGTVLLLGLLAILVCFGARTLVKKYDGIYWRLPPAAAEFAARTPLKIKNSDLCRNPADNRSDVNLDCAVGAAGAEPQFLFMGDSHAQALAMEFATLAKQANIAGYVLSRSGCPPVSDFNEVQAKNFHKCEGSIASLDRLLTMPSLKTVVITGRWAVYMTGKGTASESHERRRLFAEGDEAANRAAFEALLMTTIEKIRASGRHVVIIGPVPELGFHLPTEMTKAMMQGKPAEFTLPRKDFDERQKDVLPFFAKLDTLDGVEVLYPHERLCDATQCRTTADGDALYIDDDHLSPAGAAFIAPLLKTSIGVK